VAVVPIIQSLICHVRRASSLLRPRRSERRHESVGQCRIVCGLVALARHERDWLRPVDGWFPGDRPPIPSFASLAHHLLADYPVPRFMTSVWFAGCTSDARRPQEWFKLMGRGRNIRSVDLPIPFTRTMAHHFCLAPDHFAVNHALRWGQIRGMGGNEGLAHALIATRLGQDFTHDEFWTRRPEPSSRHCVRGILPPGQRTALSSRCGLNKRGSSWAVNQSNFVSCSLVPGPRQQTSAWVRD
jgi:hypothetical protein